jgi:hypothetical protein
MTCSLSRFAVLTCTLVLALAACAKSANNSNGGNTSGTGGTAAGTGGATGVGTGGATAAGTGGATAAGTGGTTAGGAGMGAAANMPNAMCKAGASGMNPACDNCACTPDAMNGCLDELTACEGSSDMMVNKLCKAILDCATKNKCSGNACLMPCMTEITAASQYTTGDALGPATNVGTCTMMKCGSVCP